MLKIDKRQIEESKRIRNEYLICLENVKIFENKLVKLTTELNNVVSTIEESINELDEELINNKLNDLDKQISNIQIEMKPDMKKIKQLKKEADILFESIRDKNPGVTKEELKNELYPHISEIDKKFFN